MLKIYPSCEPHACSRISDSMSPNPIIADRNSTNCFSGSSCLLNTEDRMSRAARRNKAAIVGGSALHPLSKFMATASRSARTSSIDLVMTRSLKLSLGIQQPRKSSAQIVNSMRDCTVLSERFPLSTRAHGSQRPHPITRLSKPNRPIYRHVRQNLQATSQRSRH